MISYTSAILVLQYVQLHVGHLLYILCHRQVTQSTADQTSVKRQKQKSDIRLAKDGGMTEYKLPTVTHISNTRFTTFLWSVQFLIKF